MLKIGGIGVALALAALGGCKHGFSAVAGRDKYSTARAVPLPDNRRGFLITCDGRRADLCYRRAQNLCSSGYRIEGQDRSQQTSLLPGAYGPVVISRREAEVMISCNPPAEE